MPAAPSLPSAVRRCAFCAEVITLLEKLQGEIEEEGKSEAAAYDKCSPIDFFRTETI